MTVSDLIPVKNNSSEEEFEDIQVINLTEFYLEVRDGQTFFRSRIKKIPWEEWKELKQKESGSDSVVIQKPKKRK